MHQNRLVAWLCPNLMEDNALPQSRLQTPGLRGRGKERDVKKRGVERERHGMGERKERDREGRGVARRGGEGAGKGRVLPRL